MGISIGLIVILLIFLTQTYQVNGQSDVKKCTVLSSEDLKLTHCGEQFTIQGQEQAYSSDNKTASIVNRGEFPW